MWKYTDSLKTPIGKVGYRYDSSFVSFAKINLAITPKKIVTDTKNRPQHLSLQWKAGIPQHYANFILQHPSNEDTVRVGLFKEGKWLQDFPTSLTPLQMLKEKEGIIIIDADLPKGNYYLRVAINRGNRYPTHNSEKIEWRVD
jgi:hypothetical protein